MKITAYDYAQYGTLSGKLDHISADAIVDEKGQSYYKIRVRTEGGFAARPDEQLAIIPGMTAEVDILTGKRTVLRHLTNPISRARERALRER